MKNQSKINVLDELQSATYPLYDIVFVLSLFKEEKIEEKKECKRC